MRFRCSMALSLFALAACAAAAAADYLGSARPPKEIHRVVSLAPNLTEIVFALGAGELVVGVSRYDDYPPSVIELPKVGGFIDPSIEAIVALRPDLVIVTPNPGSKESLQVLDRLAIPVLVLSSYGMDDIFSAIGDLGKILGRDAQAAALRVSMHRRLDEIRKQAVALPSHPRVLMIYGHQPLVAAAEGSFADALLGLAGATNVMSGVKVRYPTVPLERVLELDPDVIIDASAGGGELPEESVSAFWKRWQVLHAVRSGRLHVFDSSVWFRPGPRVIEGLEKLFELIHGKPPVISD